MSHARWGIALSSVASCEMRKKKLFQLSLRIYQLLRCRSQIVQLCAPKCWPLQPLSSVRAENFPLKRISHEAFSAQMHT